MTTYCVGMSETEMDGELFEDIAKDLAKRIDSWETASASEQYQSQVRSTDRITSGFIEAIRAASFVFTRYPEANKWLLHRFIDDFLESAIAIRVLAAQGVFNIGRRELRYLVEAAVKHVYVDQQLPGDTPLQDRLGFLGDTKKVPRSSVKPVDQLTIRMLTQPEVLLSAVHSAFGALSGYTHLSKRQLDERLNRASRGEFIGFESTHTLETFNKLLFRTYDVVLALIFEGIGPAFTGDLFVNIFDAQPDWRFHKGPIISEISRSFDYKHERQARH